MDKLLAANLDTIKKNILASGLDWTICVDGDEGSGKTTMAVDICHYFDPKFSEKQVAYSYTQVNECIDEIGYVDQIDKSNWCRAILLDEGAEALYRMDFAKRDVKELVKLFFRIRKKHILFVVCIPDFRFDLIKTLQRRRFKTLIHTCWDQDEEGLLRQGKYQFFSYASVKRIAETGEYGRADFEAKFTNKNIPIELWNAIQEKNSAFLEAVDNRKRIVEEAKWSFDLKVIAALDKLLGPELASKAILSADILKAVSAEYGTQPNWLNPQMLGRQLRKMGFKKHEVLATGITDWRIERDALNKHAEFIRNKIEQLSVGSSSVNKSI